MNVYVFFALMVGIIIASFLYSRRRARLDAEAKISLMREFDAAIQEEMKRDQERQHEQTRNINSLANATVARARTEATAQKFAKKSDDYAAPVRPVEVADSAADAIAILSHSFADDDTKNKTTACDTAVYSSISSYSDSGCGYDSGSSGGDCGGGDSGGGCGGGGD